MKIAAAQTKPIKGDIEKNIASHLKLIDETIKHKVDAVFFPELSITGYEPELAATLATTEHDSRFEVFQQLANSNDIAIAICYELNEPAHANYVMQQGASFYMACTVNSKNGIDKDLNRLAAIAQQYKVPVLMSNCIGITGGYDCAGKTSAWDANGNLLTQLNGEQEGVLLLDTDTMQTTINYLA
jgi:predicted amidohydrolase